MSLSEAVAWAEEHLFDRHSVVPECQVWQEALGRARGGDFPIAELKRLTSRRGYVRDGARPGEVTLRDVVLREWEIVRIATEGLGERNPLVRGAIQVNPKLDDDQRTALETLLRSTNMVSLFRGGAGTGKSFALRELVAEIQKAGRDTAVLAPQRQQVVEMETTGFPSPQTVSAFLKRGQLAAGAVVIVDEAGQIGGRQMVELLRLVRGRTARLILSGDTRQHGPVEASDALVAIERYAGVTHIDALNHFGLEGKIWNGFTPEKHLGDKGWKKTGAETIPPVIARGVLIDVATFKGRQVLTNNYRVNADDLKGALKQQGVQLEKGDVVLIRTGQARHYHDAGKYLHEYPGINLDAVKWLVEDQGAMLLGADNLSLEAFPPEREDNWVPVHTYLLAERGVMFIEQMQLEELARDRVYEFAFIAASLKLRGASGSPMRPLALPVRK